jgi:peptide/nickel transport system substrate-binding protein
MKFTRSAKVALTAAAAAALAVSLLTPAQAATRSTIVIHDTNSLTSFNSGQPDTNLTINGKVGNLSGIGFLYINDKKNVIRNTVFGNFKITKNAATDFRISYTVNPGLVWSDGTPINGVDLLMSHVLSSNKFSIDAGLGNPDSEDTAPAFDSNGYGGTYSDNIVGQPVLSADKMTLTLQFKQRIANWDLYGPGPSPVHTLVHLAEGKNGLQSVADNEAARNRFFAAYSSKNTAVLKSIAKVWSEAYDITEVSSSTNPLLFVGNGGFLVSNAVTKSSVTLKVNPKYNSGPKLSGTIDTVIFKFIADGTAAAQALANGELDIYSGQPTADAVAALKKLTNVNLIGGINACYEHWDTRVDAAPGQPEYTGIFKGHGGKGADLRKAFLLSVPREEINEKLIKPINPNAPILGSTFIAPGFEGYERLIANNGSSFYRGSQAELNAKATRLLRKHYPTAGPSNPVKVTVLVPGNNTRRAAEFALAKANALKVGFDLVGDVQASWSPKIQLSTYDVQFFAYCPSAVTQAGTNSNFQLGGGNNRNGVNLPNLDAILNKLQLPMDNRTFITTIIAAERIIHAEGLTSGVFLHPAVTAVNKELKGIKPSPLSDDVVWNWWEWSY